MVHDRTVKKQGLICGDCGERFGPKIGAKVELTEEGRPIVMIGASNGHEFGVRMSWEVYGEFVRQAILVLAHSPAGAIAGLEVERVPGQPALVDLDLDVTPLSRIPARPEEQIH